MEFVFNVAKLTIGQETVLASAADSILSWTGRKQRKLTAEFCQDKVGQSFKIPASQKSLSDILEL